MVSNDPAPGRPASEGICLLDEDGVIKGWNAAMARLTGLEQQEVLGERWSERVIVRDRHGRRLDGMEIAAVSSDEELEVVGVEGPHQVAITSGRVHSADGKSWVIVVRDMTPEHDLQRSRSEFVAAISHDLMTPLTAIRGALQVLGRPKVAANTALGKEMVQIMKRGSERLERLVMNLVTMSQIEAGDLGASVRELDLVALVRSRIDAILFDHPQVELSGEESVVVLADRERLGQAVEHILDNARKFGPGSGIIRIEIATNDGTARLSISDEGPGIAAADRQRIFERFVRLGDPQTRETKGSGIGLFIAKRSLEAMGGSVEVESEPNLGATFHVRIPLAPSIASLGSGSAG